jgi:hypothetical protein
VDQHDATLDASGFQLARDLDACSSGNSLVSAPIRPSRAITITPHQFQRVILGTP